MSDPKEIVDEIARMWQEGALYESQGLYDHALEVYQGILQRDPTDKHAQAKVVQLQFSEKMHADTGARPNRLDDLAPRQSLDLGIAYLEMELYQEALSEFRRALHLSPMFRGELLRHISTSLVRLKQFDEAVGLLGQFLAEPLVSPVDKGEVAEELARGLIEAERPADALAVLTGLSHEVVQFVDNYRAMIEALSDPDLTGRDLSSAHDAGPSEVLPAETPPTESAGAEGVAETAEPTVPLRTGVRYSLDSKNWHDGTCQEISKTSALIHATTRLAMGDSAVLLINLPTAAEDEPVWIISRVASVEELSREDDILLVRLDFQSFLPGGEAMLNGFVDRAGSDPSILELTIPPIAEIDPNAPSVVFRALEEEALRAMEHADVPSDVGRVTGKAIAEAAAGREQPPQTPKDKTQEATGPRRGYAVRSGPPPVQTDPDPSRILRFACECGQVHDVPRTRVGHKGKCANCGKDTVVPVVDTRRDGMTDKVIGRLVGGCRILYKIGGGGMGGVFKGYHIALDIHTAVKILYAHLAERDPVFVKRFIREARATAKLQHPNIVGVMNVGFEDGFH
ncbi:MAG: hypothetical protein V2B18_10610, partial [Pseudomonadota bacterium]